MNKSTGHEPTFTWSQMQKQIELAVKQEREACAKICEEMGIEEYGTLAIAAAIRKRNQT